MNRRTKAGKHIVFGFNALVGLIFLPSIASQVYFREFDASEVIGLFFVAFLCRQLWIGRYWARWLWVFFLFAVGASFYMFALEAKEVVLIVMAVPPIFLGSMLALPAVGDFQRWQRAQKT